MELYVGLALMALGIVLLVLGRSRSKTVRVAASGGSVAVGGKNTGSIICMSERRLQRRTDRTR